MSMGEVRLSLRLIAKQPILSATIILALATGICLAMIGFTVRDLVVNSTLPFQAGDRFTRFVAFDREGDRVDPDIERYHAFRDRAASFEHIGAVIGRSFTVAQGSGDVESIAGALITPRRCAGSRCRRLRAARRSPPMVNKAPSAWWYCAKASGGGATVPIPT